MNRFFITAAVLAGAMVLSSGDVSAGHRYCDYGYSLGSPVYTGSSYGLSTYAPSRSYYFYNSRPYYYGYDGFDSSYNSRYFGRYGSPYFSRYGSPYYGYGYSPYYSPYAYGYSSPGMSFYFGSGGYSGFRYGGFGPSYGRSFRSRGSFGQRHRFHNRSGGRRRR